MNVDNAHWKFSDYVHIRTLIDGAVPNKESVTQDGAGAEAFESVVTAVGSADTGVGRE